MSTDPKKITQLLDSIRTGNRESMNELYQAVYPKMRLMAQARMRGERSNHTLQPTALVHEAYLRLFRENGIDWQDRKHFFAVAARVMREILVDHAREKRALKRGGKDAIRVEFDDTRLSGPGIQNDIEALDDALKQLEKSDPRQSQIVELRYFAGLEIEEIAETLEISASTVKREWAAAKLWLYRELRK